MNRLVFWHKSIVVQNEENLPVLCAYYCTCRTNVYVAYFMAVKATKINAYIRLLDCTSVVSGDATVSSPIDESTLLSNVAVIDGVSYVDIANLTFSCRTGGLLDGVFTDSHSLGRIGLLAKESCHIGRMGRQRIDQARIRCMIVIGGIGDGRFILSVGMRVSGFNNVGIDRSLLSRGIREKLLFTLTRDLIPCFLVILFNRVPSFFVDANLMLALMFGDEGLVCCEGCLRIVHLKCIIRASAVM